MASFSPTLDAELAEGEGGLEDWWEAVKDKVEEIVPGAGAAIDGLDFVGLYNRTRPCPSEDVIPVHPVPLPRCRRRDHDDARRIRRLPVARRGRSAQAVLEADDAPPRCWRWPVTSSNGLISISVRWNRRDCCAPKARCRRSAPSSTLVSLMAILAAGILFGPAGSEIRSDGDLLGFFEKVRALYGHRKG